MYFLAFWPEILAYFAVPASERWSRWSGCGVGLTPVAHFLKNVKNRLRWEVVCASLGVAAAL